MKMKRYVLVIPFWGESHLKIWLKCSLPSYFSESNIPFMVNNANFSMLICTDYITESLIKESPEFNEIKKLCNIRFLNIQYIINYYNNIHYGYILTHSYHEAIKKYGRSATHIQFIFLNADFVLANGVFKTVHQLVTQGSEIIFCPSFRVVKEEFYNDIENKFNNKKNIKVLSIEPREMVELAFKHIHPTINAQTINNKNGLRSEVTNQFYLKIGKNILLGNHFVIFPLLIKPRKIPTSPTGFIDYNVIYDFQKNGKISYIKDSDDAFIVEPEYKEKECEYLVFNSKVDSNYYFKMLSRWVNKTHYNNANQRLIFHSENVNWKDVLIKEKVAELDKFIEGIIKKFNHANSFSPYVHHSYWRDASLLSKSFFRKKAILLIRKIITKTIEFSSKIKFNKSYFLITNIKSSRFLMGNLLKINKLYSKNLPQVDGYSVYIDIEHYTISQLMDINFPFNRTKIYLFAFDYDRNVYNAFIKQRISSICQVKNINQHKIFLSSILRANIENNGLLYKIKLAIHVMTIKKYLKSINPYPNFIVLEYLPSSMPDNTPDASAV